MLTLEEALEGHDHLTGHPLCPDETGRGFEKLVLGEMPLERGTAIMFQLVVNFCAYRDKHVSRVFFTEVDGVLVCEAFYKDGAVTDFMVRPDTREGSS